MILIFGYFVAGLICGQFKFCHIKILKICKDFKLLVWPTYEMHKKLVLQLH